MVLVRDSCNVKRPITLNTRDPHHISCQCFHTTTPSTSPRSMRERKMHVAWRLPVQYTGPDNTTAYFFLAAMVFPLRPVVLVC